MAIPEDGDLEIRRVSITNFYNSSKEREPSPQVDSLYRQCFSYICENIQSIPSILLPSHICQQIYNRIIEKSGNISLSTLKSFAPYSLQQIELISATTDDWFVPLGILFWLHNAIGNQLNLEKLQLVNCRILDSHFPILSQMKFLNSLVIDRCLKVTPNALQYLPESLTHLELRRFHFPHFPMLIFQVI